MSPCRVANRGLRSAKQGRQAQGRLLILQGQRLGKQMAELCSAAVQAGVTDKVSPIAQSVDALVSARFTKASSIEACIHPSGPIPLTHLACLSESVYHPLHDPA